jgi:hypothetical protein
MSLLRPSRSRRAHAAHEGELGDPRLKLVYEESVRALGQQAVVLDELRTRTGVLLAAASVSSAFLGAQVLARHPHFSGWNIAALLSFGVVVVLCIVVLWPSGGWVFTHKIPVLLNGYVKPGKTIDYMYENLASENYDCRKNNATKCKRRFIAFQVACVALGTDVLFWLINLGTKG